MINMFLAGLPSVYFEINKVNTQMYHVILSKLVYLFVRRIEPLFERALRKISLPGMK